jgi:hypothetical protein
MNGADSASVNGTRAEYPAKMIECLAEQGQNRFLKRKEAAEKFTGSIAPLVKVRMDKSVARFLAGTHVTTSFKGTQRKHVVLTMGPKKITRKVDFSGDKATCECKESAVSEFPCGCMLVAAEKVGLPWASLLNEHDSVKTWKEQYEDLPTFIVPGTEQLESITPDPFLVAAAGYPIPRGRPSKKRKKGVVEGFKQKSQAAKKAKAQAAHGDVN